MFTRILFLAAFMLLVDIINHFGIKAMMRRLKESKAYRFNLIAYWSIGILVAIALVISLLVTGYPGLDYEKYRIYFFLFGFWLLFYLPRFTFSHFVVLQAAFYALQRLFRSGKSYRVQRPKRKSFLIQKFGLFVSLIVGVLVIYGMTWGKTDYIIKHEEIKIAKLPNAFDGFTIAQFSDAHLGSFTYPHNAREGFALIQAQKPDMIVFTGDMVNNIADEMEPYLNDLRGLSAPYGKYSILGNHDMSDYVKWKDFDIQQEYIQKLIRYQQEAGFDVLLNQNDIVRIGNQELTVIGVENWGLPPFKQYGNLSEAMQGVNSESVKILLSHDPSHWEAEIINQTDIDLTLSGHTHGMQMGIRLPWFQWSPVKYLYPRWLGLYKQGKQYLYVNPGFGFIGFPGRVGIRPEITIFTLRKE